MSLWWQHARVAALLGGSTTEWQPARLAACQGALRQSADKQHDGFDARTYDLARAGANGPEG